MTTLRDDLRIARRTASFVGMTSAMLVAMETERALATTDAGRSKALYDWIERYGRFLLDLYGVEPIAGGLHADDGVRYPGTDAHGRGRLFVMNHRSMLDIFLTLRFIEATIVSRADLARWPVIGLAARRVEVLFVDRSDKKSGAAVVRAMAEAIDRGRAVLVYAEGTTFADDEVRPFRQGAFQVATRCKAEIVPVGLAYESPEATYGDEPFVAHLSRIASRKHTRVALQIGEPILPAAGLDAEQAREEARARVQALVHRARAALGRPGGASRTR